MAKMRAKMEVIHVEEFRYWKDSGSEDEKHSERLTFRAVCRDGYPADGLDEDNTYAKYTPQADMTITVANPALFGQFECGQKYYIDFTPVPN